MKIFFKTFSFNKLLEKKNFIIIGKFDFAETLERLASVVFLLLLGGSAVDGALGALTPAGVAVGVGVVFVIRPAAGLISLAGSGLDQPARRAISFFGIRGMGTVYYLAHAVTEERFPRALEVWAVAIFVIIASIIVHGVTATPALAKVDHAGA